MSRIVLCTDWRLIFKASLTLIIGKNSKPPPKKKKRTHSTKYPPMYHPYLISSLSQEKYTNNFWHKCTITHYYYTLKCNSLHYTYIIYIIALVSSLYGSRISYIWIHPTCVITKNCHTQYLFPSQCVDVAISDY